MAWIESHDSLYEHAKTRKAAKMLDVSVPTIMGHLHCLWHWALTHAEDGDLSDFTAKCLARAAGWERKRNPGEFVEALACARFLQRHGPFGDPDEGRFGDLVLCNWWHYNGKRLRRRQSLRLSGGQGWVYLVAGGALTKIGMTKVSPQSRLTALQTGSPVELRLLLAARVPDPAKAERGLHALFAEQRRHGEWFELTDEDVEKASAALSSSEKAATT